VEKSWTLKELHLNFFDYFKDVLLRWYREPKDKSKHEPQYKHPDTGELLTAESVTELFNKAPLEKQFEAFFPNLSEQNWKEELNKRFFE